MKDAGPAFPHFQPRRFKSFDIERGIAELESGDTQFPGMSLRDYFAAAALTGAQQWDAIINGKNAAFAKKTALADLAEVAYAIADAMLAERAKK